MQLEQGSHAPFATSAGIDLDLIGSESSDGICDSDACRNIMLNGQSEDPKILEIY